MSAVPKHKMTADEYLAIERAAEFKSEFFDGVMYPLHHDPLTGMAGASRIHNRVKENVIGELFSAFKRGPCQTYSSDQRVRLSETGMFAYPDVVIVCDPPVFDSHLDTLLNPQVIVEVLSPSTEKYDRGFKFAMYQKQPTIREVVFIAQDRMRIERYVRQPDATWVLTVFEDADADFALGTVEAHVPLRDLYRGVDFGDAE